MKYPIKVRYQLHVQCTLYFTNISKHLVMSSGIPGTHTRFHIWRYTQFESVGSLHILILLIIFVILLIMIVILLIMIVILLIMTVILLIMSYDCYIIDYDCYIIDYDCYITDYVF